MLYGRVLVLKPPNGTHWKCSRRGGYVTGLLRLADDAGNKHIIDALHQKGAIGLRAQISRSDVNN